MTKKKPKKTPHIAAAFFGMVLGMVINISLQLYLIPYLPFVTTDYWQYLPVGITTAILTSFLEFLSHTTILNSMKLVFKLARHAISIFGLYYLIRIFPFDFNLINYPFLNTLILFAFIIAFLALILAFIIDFIKLSLSLLFS